MVRTPFEALKLVRDMGSSNQLGLIIEADQEAK